MKNEFMMAILLVFLGMAIELFLKYVVVGLRNWDNLFHRERSAVDASGPYAMFEEPLLGLFKS
jgi:hypothetical protein